MHTFACAPHHFLYIISFASTYIYTAAVAASIAHKATMYANQMNKKKKEVKEEKMNKIGNTMARAIIWKVKENWILAAKKNWFVCRVAVATHTAANASFQRHLEEREMRDERVWKCCVAATAMRLHESEMDENCNCMVEKYSSFVCYCSRESVSVHNIKIIRAQFRHLQTANNFSRTTITIITTINMYNDVHAFTNCSGAYRTLRFRRYTMSVCLPVRTK